MGWGANTFKSWKVGHGFEKVENPWARLWFFLSRGLHFRLSRSCSDWMEWLELTNAQLNIFLRLVIPALEVYLLVSSCQTSRTPFVEIILF